MHRRCASGLARSDHTCPRATAAASTAASAASAASAAASAAASSAAAAAAAAAPAFAAAAASPSTFWLSGPVPASTCKAGCPAPPVAPLAAGEVAGGDRRHTVSARAWLGLGVGVAVG